jgi:hypothetical protein
VNLIMPRAGQAAAGFLGALKTSLRMMPSDGRLG